MVKISEEHFITGKIETIENDVTPIIKQLNSTGLQIDIGVVEKIRNHYLQLQKECAEKIFSLAGYKFDLGKKIKLKPHLNRKDLKLAKVQMHL